MKHLVEFPLQSGGSIVVEVDEPEEAGPSRVARGDKIDKVKENFEEAINKVMPVATSVLEKLKNNMSKPAEVEVTFGIKLSTAVGAILASAAAEANLEVTMRWTEKS